VWWLATWVGCLSDAEVAARLERGLSAANDAVAIGLVATELRTQARLPSNATTRHATGCGCPCRSIIGEPPVYVLTAAYHPEGCLPDSGLVGGGVFGVMVHEVDGDAVRTSLAEGGIGAVPTDGVLEGDVTTSGAVASRGLVTTTDRAFDLTLRSRWDGTTAALDGVVTVDGSPVRLEGVVLDPAGLADECPTPARGVATVDVDGRDVTVDFALPGGGLATASVGGHESEPTDPCAFASGLY
jgi:hypothetical protein